MQRILNNCSLMRVLDVFFQDPHKNYQLREISRIIKLDHKSVLNHVKKLVKLKLVKIDTTTLYKSYRADVNDYFKKLKMASNMIKLKESGLIDYIHENTMPKAITVFGSYSKGTDRPESDIDIFVDSEERSLELSEFNKKLRRNIHLLFSGDMSNELKNNLANGITLTGSLRLFR
ncbi:hypothetical protein GF336_01730 [Candidatus Woesearchaeota archaeon]|nr:hypothetical protein [Candidatus Woesearchaeota archaeon]